jgi:ankyrin repeat protein
MLLPIVSCTNRSAVPAGDAKVSPAPFRYPLTKASALGDLDKMRDLLQRGADINERSGQPEVTPLLAAVAAKQEKAALYLLDQGANPRMLFRGYDALDFSRKHLGDDSAVTLRLIQDLNRHGVRR